ncbi:hypothetical protein D9M71_490210 [compost metagenome]
MQGSIADLIASGQPYPKDQRLIDSVRFTPIGHRIRITSPTISSQTTWLGVSTGADFALGYAKAHKNHLWGGAYGDRSSPRAAAFRT